LAKKFGVKISLGKNLRTKMGKNNLETKMGKIYVGNSYRGFRLIAIIIILVNGY